MNERINRLQSVITTWQGITAQSHRFGGLEFNLGGTEIGHVHLNGMVDIPFNSKIQRQLIAENRAQPHHLFPETGWITFYIRKEADIEQALWLFRLSYLFNAPRGHNRASPHLDLPAEEDALGLSEPLRIIVDHLITRTQRSE